VRERKEDMRDVGEKGIHGCGLASRLLGVVDEGALHRRRPVSGFIQSIVEIGVLQFLQKILFIILNIGMMLQEEVEGREVKGREVAKCEFAEGEVNATWGAYWGS